MKKSLLLCLLGSLCLGHSLWGSPLNLPVDLSAGLTQYSFKEEQDATSGQGIGGRADFRVHPLFRLGVGASLIFSQNLSETVDLTIGAIDIEGRFSLDDPFKQGPYAIVGARSSTLDDSEFAFGVGFGYEMPISDPWWVQLEFGQFDESFFRMAAVYMHSLHLPNAQKMRDKVAFLAAERKGEEEAEALAKEQAEAIAKAKAEAAEAEAAAKAALEEQETQAAPVLAKVEEPKKVVKKAPVIKRIESEEVFVPWALWSLNQKWPVRQNYSKNRYQLASVSINEDDGKDLALTRIEAVSLILGSQYHISLSPEEDAKGYLVEYDYTDPQFGKRSQAVEVHPDEALASMTLSDMDNKRFSAFLAKEALQKGFFSASQVNGKTAFKPLSKLKKVYVYIFLGRVLLHQGAAPSMDPKVSDAMKFLSAKDKMAVSTLFNSLDLADSWLKNYGAYMTRDEAVRLTRLALKWRLANQAELTKEEKKQYEKGAIYRIIEASYVNEDDANKRVRVLSQAGQSVTTRIMGNGQTRVEITGYTSYLDAQLGMTSLQSKGVISQNTVIYRLK